MAGFRHFPELALAACTLILPGPARADEAANLKLSGLVQVDAVLREQSSVDELDPASREPLNQQRFALQRARLRADAHYAFVRGAVMVEGTTARAPAVRLLGAELSAVYPDDAPLVELTLGLFLIPFGLETTEPVVERLFLEPSTWVQALFPGRRDLGVRLHGTWRFLRGAVAVMNGHPIGDASLPLRDPNRAKDLIGRIGVDDGPTAWLRVSAGLSALLGRGFHPGVAPGKDTFTIRDVNEDGIAQPSEIELVAGDPGEPSKSFDRRALGGDLALHYTLPRLGAGKLYGELVWAVDLDRARFISDPVASGRSARQLGAMVALRQAITRHVELGVRYDRYDPDRDARDRRGARIVPHDATFSTLAATVAWCTLAHLRVALQFDHRENPLGRDRRGAPTTLAADDLILRGQLEL